MLQHPTTPLAELGVTPEQIGNLEKLASWLLNHADQINFNMEIFARAYVSSEENDEIGENPADLWAFVNEHKCGAVGCAIGHGPAAGIAPLKGEEWVAYAIRAFGVQGDARHGARGPLWEFLFSSDWSGADNSASGAGKRILYALDHGVPSVADTTVMQCDEDAPLCYLEEAPAQPSL